MRRGVIVLTEGRSGSNWLGSLARNAGLGNSGEWLDPASLGLSPRRVDFETYFNAIMNKSSSATDNFYVKIFPRHLFRIHRHFFRDFIQTCIDRNDTKLIVLTRKDRLRQAISFARGLQTNQWTSKREAKKDAAYDFNQICRCYFLIGRSYEFWKSYLDLNNFPAENFVYEELIDDPSPFINSVAAAMGKPYPSRITSELEVQRDDTTEEWMAKFQADIKEIGVLENATPSRLPPPTLSNALRFRLQTH